MTDGTDGTGQRAAGAADPATLRALVDARAGARSLSDALLTHLPDVGDLATQRLLDAWVEQGADTLRALAEALEERLLDLGSAGADPAPATHHTDHTDHSVEAGGFRGWAP
ncbi:hypothetical protein [Intrasporangium sp. YIM S08009]|uniref:hypothetical protein n=1 Tax=Intrasporangium zincisolvens TaxID=3080018 RepID=UPI002B05D250|nr:hypothetical protein [Intrasporangium sp. YIM S08009]